MSFEDNIRRVTPYTPGEQPKSDDLIKLNTNENPYPPSPKCKEALTDLDISKGAYGTNLLKKGERLMEIKIAGAMPIEIARILSELKIYKSSYSKYGSGYLQLLEREKYEKGIRKYV